MRVGTTLDMTRIARELAQVSIPRFADFATVDVTEPVLRGEEPRYNDDTRMRRVAVSGVRDDHPFSPLGGWLVFHPSTPQSAGLRSGRAVIARRLEDVPGWQAQDPEHNRRIIAHGVHSLITVPLASRGTIFGVVDFWRARHREPFGRDDLALAEELVRHAAASIDNAHCYTCEHVTAVTLQRSLLPHSLPGQSALDAAYRYLPAQAGVGGDWVDVIPLPGSRVALVVGDVVGHGLHAAATMGRLRTAVHSFAALDLPPDELLRHLDDLVSQMDRDQWSEGGEGSVGGATCLYAIYDPVTQRCVLSRAGHPPPALVHPDGRVVFPDLPAGPLLGLGGGSFESAEWKVPEASRLVLYTDGLIEDRKRDIDVGLMMLREALSRGAGNGADAPEATCTAILDAMLPDRQNDDIALLVCRMRGLPAEQVAGWPVPHDPAAVAHMRTAAARKLAEWGLEELACTTELILSELITNAIRHTEGPIHLRLVRDRALICEVADCSRTSPHIRQAAITDEGGRGLYLVARLAERWGMRPTASGKVIWAEQFLPGGPPGASRQPTERSPASP